MIEAMQELGILETERLLLRPPTEGDVDAWAAFLTDPVVARYLGPSLSGREAVEAHVARVLERHAADGFGLLALERKEDGRVIGRSGFLVWDRRTWRPGTLRDAGDAAEVEIGWALAADCWGRGYATEAGAACRDAGFEQLGLERVSAIIQPRNERSQAVARRLGMAPGEALRTASGLEAQLWTVRRRSESSESSSRTPSMRQASR
jgi:RimJ/RimL family protein N-acetyltransferase